jgi:aspartate aminotransferase
MLADRLSRIKPSPTVAVTAKANELKAAGHDVIGLGAGEPDFNTPEHIKQAAIKAMADNKTRYTAVDGIAELKQAICDKFKKDNNISCTPDMITVGSGGKQVLYNALMASINSGDEVVIPAPFWVSYPDMVLLAEGIPVIVECGRNKNFKITADALENAITDKTKWVILNSPSNPTGVGYTKTDLEALAEVLRKYPHVNIMTDDMYEYLVYDDFKFTTMVEIAPDLQDRTLTCNGVSKAYCMTGWRIGYATGPKPLIKGIAKIQSQSTTNPNTIAQYAALAALNGPVDFLADNNAAFVRRRNFVVSRLNSIDGLQCSMPDGAFYVYPSCAGVIGKKTPDGTLIKTDSDYVTYLLNAEGVACVQGTAFGLSPYFRISYATSDTLLDDALNRIERATIKLR